MPNRSGSGGRVQMAGDELRAVLKQYQLGKVTGVQEFRRGSTRFPKAVVTTAAGQRYLLKRRTGTTEDLDRLAYSHAVQCGLVQRRFPLANLVRSVGDGTWVVWNEHMYELFEFVAGERFSQTEPQTRMGGMLLAQLHAALCGWSTPVKPPVPGGYHQSRTVARSWERVADAIGQVDGSARPAEIAQLLASLEQRYRSAAELASSKIDRTPGGVRQRVIHGDYHPGNLLFAEANCGVMIDFDGVRPDLPVIDVANGSLQFSMHPAGDLPTEQWKSELDLGRLEVFLRGYSRDGATLLDADECEAVAPLMIEASIAESIPRIALSGTFAQRRGVDVLAFVERKTAWIWGERAMLATICRRCMSRRS